VICKNCHTEFDDSKNYCPDCGAKHIRNRLTTIVLLNQINDQFLSIDNRFLITFLDLFKKPEKVINGYINGLRRKYIDVLQYFAIALTLAGIQVFLMEYFFTSELESSFEILKKIDSSTQENNPFYAVASWLTNFLIKPYYSYNFTEHLVLNIYYYTQIIIITAVLSILFLCFGLDYLLISGLVSIFTLIYHYYTLKRVFRLDFWESVAFFMLVMVSFVIVGMIGSFIYLIVLYLGGNLP
jgi:hypothetical protein